jgi:hypothetical protein
MASENLHWREYSKNKDYCDACKLAYTTINFKMYMDKIEDWWVLHYGNCIIVRFKLPRRKNLEDLVYLYDVFKNKGFKFKEYEEDDEKFTTEFDLQCFVDIMMVCTNMFYKRMSNEVDYNIGRFLERTFHCTFNILHGPYNESQFLTDLLEHGVKLSDFPADKYNFAVYNQIL